MSQSNITMVAFHGAQKPQSLTVLLRGVFRELANAVGPSYSDAFEPFKESQIHATLIGMEADVVGLQFYGHWFHENRSGARRAVDVHRFLSILRRVARRVPIFAIRFGGFRKAHCTCLGKSVEGWACPTSGSEFHSCDRSAYEASFYAYAPGPAVLTGWPIGAADALSEFPHSLYDFRLAAESAGFLDKYHTDEAPHWMDDDCFIKLGSFKSSLGNLSNVEHSIREYLCTLKPVTVDIRAEDVSVLLYKDPSLKEEAIVDRVALSEAIADERRIIQLYHQLL